MNSLLYAMEFLGLPAGDRESLRAFLGPPLEDMFAEYCGCSAETAKKAVEKYRERYSAIGLYENRLYEGTEAALQKLREGELLLCVATSKPEDFARRILERHGLTGYFHEIAGATFDGRIGTKAQVLEELFSRLGGSYSPQKTLMVGDRFYDVRGASACGIPTLGVSYGYGTEEELREAGARLIASDPADMARKALDFFGKTGGEP